VPDALAALDADFGFRRDMRVALYLGVSTARQAEKDLSIPDQRNQLERWSNSLRAALQASPSQMAGKANARVARTAI
jgi:hypothetical protein